MSRSTRLKMTKGYRFQVFDNIRYNDFDSRLRNDVVTVITTRPSGIEFCVCAN